MDSIIRSRRLGRFVGLIPVVSLVVAGLAGARATAAAPITATAEPSHPLAALAAVTAELELALRDGELPSGPAQAGTWTGIEIEGASCGRGAPFKFYFNESAAEDAGILILLNGGGACLKEGPAPEGATGIARSLYCMAFENFEDPFMNDGFFTGLLAGIAVPQVLPVFNRAADNPFRDFHLVAVPYCTGDVFAGNVAEAYDYDPRPDERFDVTHRGHLNVLAVVEWLYERYPEELRPVVLTGISAGGFGAIYNFPEFIERWPLTTLVPDSGIAPPIDDSLLAREGETVVARWDAGSLIPSYCEAADCLSSSYRLLAAHAEEFDGKRASWRPFGYVQSQQDGTLVDYLETSSCGYQLGLRRGRGETRPDNLRAYVPATNQHVFHAINPLDGGAIFVSQAGVDMMEWFRAAATAESAEDLPADAIDPWLPCNQAFMPMTIFGR